MEWNFVPQVFQTEQHREHCQPNIQHTAMFLNCLRVCCIMSLLTTQRGSSCGSQTWTELQHPQTALFGEAEQSQVGIVSWLHFSCRTSWRSICATEVILLIWSDSFKVGNLSSQPCLDKHQNAAWEAGRNKLIPRVSSEKCG